MGSSTGLSKFSNSLIRYLLVKGVCKGLVMIWEQYMHKPTGKFTLYDLRTGKIENKICGLKKGKPFHYLIKDITASPWEAYYSKEMIAERPLTEK